MEPVRTLDEFWSRAGARYITGRSFIYFSAAPTLYGFVMFGQSDDLDLRDICEAIERELDRSSPHASYLDAHRVEGIDPAALTRLGEVMTRRRESMKKKLTCVSMVQPPGFLGALFAGLHVVLPRPVPTRRFATEAEALAWAKWRDLSLVGTLDAICSSASGGKALLPRLRTLLESRPGRISLAEAASELRISVRSLQRHLRNARRNFRDEAAEAQVRIAQKRLTETDDKLTAIAGEVGASPQHFSALFRRITGESPSRWRERSRGSA